jgi:hypothetical protein
MATTPPTTMSHVETKTATAMVAVQAVSAVSLTARQPTTGVAGITIAETRLASAPKLSQNSAFGISESPWRYFAQHKSVPALAPKGSLII